MHTNHTTREQRREEVIAEGESASSAMKAEDQVQHANERALCAEKEALVAKLEAKRQVEEANKNKAIAEERLAAAEMQFQMAERRAQDGLGRERLAHRHAQLEERLKGIAEQNYQEAEQKRQELERRCQELEQQCRDVEQRCNEAEQRCRQAEYRCQALKEQCQAVEQQCRLAEQRYQEAVDELCEVKNHWMIQREDTEITDVELGKGGWGVVKLATYCGKKVAAKCFYKILSSPYYRQLFEREMNMAARLRHPNLVQFIGALVDGEPIILMELMSRSLRNLLESGPITQQQVTSMCIDVALALNYLHKLKPHPIIHRDLSSANVPLNPLPDNQWKAKVSDYGSVNLLTQVRTVGPGSPVYTAPEADNPQLQSPKMDIFSFGVLMVEMLTDQFPEVRIRRRLIGSIDHAEYVQLIHQCISEDKERRPSAEQVLSQLNRF